MLLKGINGQSIRDAFVYGLILALAMFAMPVFAQSVGAGGTTLSPLTMLATLQEQIPNLTRMVTAMAYVIGAFMVIRGVVEFKHAGEMRTQMSHEHHLTKPILQITIGALLIYLPSAVQIGMSTFWAEPNPYGYVIQSDQWQQVINICYAVVQFIGVVAFIRGLVMLSHSAGGHHQSSFAKGLTHVIGGIFCININQFVQTILATFGIQS